MWRAPYPIDVPNRVRIAAGVAVALVLVAGAALALSNREPTVALPSPSPTATLTPETPSPTASPTASPTSSPTVAPTPAPTQRPRPTTNVAGQQLLSYYFQTRALLPVFPPTPQIDFDEPAGEEGDAWYRGLNAAGQPIFAVREDYVMTPTTAYHELGHAYQDLVQRRNGGTDMMAKFWTYRGFPGTWQDALREASTLTGMAQWIRLPGEAWAESFSVAMIGGGHEKTLDYGRTINPFGMKSFFVSLLPPAP
jgi:hypothetical protein